MKFAVIERTDNGYFVVYHAHAMGEDLSKLMVYSNIADVLQLLLDKASGAESLVVRIEDTQSSPRVPIPKRLGKILSGKRRA
jgi:hypothetical protein